MLLGGILESGDKLQAAALIFLSLNNSLTMPETSRVGISSLALADTNQVQVSHAGKYIKFIEF